RSWRISTRLPDRSRSVIRLMVMGLSLVKKGAGAAARAAGGAWEFGRPPLSGPRHGQANRHATALLRGIGLLHQVSAAASGTSPSPAQREKGFSIRFSAATSGPSPSPAKREKLA